jgi:cytochrome P450
VDPAGGDIHGEAALLRQHGPLVPVELPGGTAAWLITSQALLKELPTDDRVSRDPWRHWPPWPDGVPAETAWMIPFMGTPNMINSCGADHNRLRRMAAPAFTRRRVQDLAPQIRQIAGELLDAMAEIACSGEAIDLRPALRDMFERLVASPADQAEALAVAKELPVLMGELVAASVPRLPTTSSAFWSCRWSPAMPASHAATVDSAARGPGSRSCRWTRGSFSGRRSPTPPCGRCAVR